MKRVKTLCVFLLAVLLVLSTVTPAFAARPSMKVYRRPSLAPNMAIEMPKDASPDVDWDAVMDAIWNFLFVDGSGNSIDVTAYQIPFTDSNWQYICSACNNSPRFLHIVPNSCMLYNGVFSLGFDEADVNREDNRAKYDACMKAMDQLLYGIKGNDSLSDVDKCLLVHDRLATWAAYDLVGLQNNTLTTDAYTPYGPLALHSGVCNGYALAYNWMLEELGFTTYYTSSRQINHGWSKVELDGQLYYVDVTWDDPTWDVPGRVKHDQFLLSGPTCSARHEGVTDFDLSPNDTRYESYITNNYGADVTSEIVLVGDKYYYFSNTAYDSTNQTGGTCWLTSRNVNGGLETAEQLVDLFWVRNYAPNAGPGSMTNYTPRLTAIGNTVLYTAGRELRAYNTVDGTTSVVNFTPSRDHFSANYDYYWNGIRQVDGVVYVTAGPLNYDATTVAEHTESFVFCSHPTSVVLSQTTGPDCKTHGDAKLICPDCRALIDGTGQGPTGSHSYTAQTVKAEALKSEATCTQAAVYYYSCAVCGAVEKNAAHTFSSGSPAAHNWQWVTDTEATCAAAGVKHEECSVCHAKRSENTPIPATGSHSYTAQTVKAEALKSAATCTQAAVYYYSCAICGVVEKNAAHTFSSGSPAAHNWQWVTDTEATCAAAGVKHEACSVCHAKRNENTPIPATGSHSYTAQTVKAEALKSGATCTQAAVYYYSCAVCGVVEKNAGHTFSSGSPAAHDWQWVTDTEATCTAAGVKHEECSVCHAKRSENTTIPATGSHSYTAQTVKDEALKSGATCTQAAVYYYSCAVCGVVEKNAAHTFSSGSPAAHNWQWVTDTEATCAAAGVKHEACSVCHAKRSQDTSIPALDHLWNDGEVVVSATCSTVGTCRYTCLREGCGAVSEKELPIDPNAHVLKTTVVPPTCLDGGYTSHDCTLCRYGYSDSEVSALGHLWNDGEVVVPATCSTVGTFRYTCLREGCGAVSEKELPSDPNAHVLTVSVVHPTCTEKGYTSHLCTFCKFGYSDTNVPALGHATLDENGICPRCGMRVESDEASGIAVSYNADSFADDAELCVTPRPDGGEALEKRYEKLAAWDVKMLANDVEVQPNDSATVSVPVPDGFDKTRLQLCYIDQNGSVFQVAFADALNGTITFTTTSFGLFIVVDESSEVATHTPGDINGDGKVNNKDLNRLMKYLAGEQVQYVAGALDVNGDGKVNNKDLNRLMKHLAGENVDIH